MPTPHSHDGTAAPRIRRPERRSPPLRGGHFTPEEASRFGLRDTALGVTICVADVIVLAALVAGALWTPWWPLQLLLSIGAGVMIGILFVVGHDAAHNSLTGSKRLNYALGQIALLPALHPFSFWVKVHNQTHHRWTNLSPKDDVWTPLSPAQYEGLGPRARVVYRYYRGLFGPLLYYFIEFWWRRIFLPSRAQVGRYTPAQRFDTAVVVLAALAYLAFLSAGVYRGWFGEEKPWWNTALFGAVLPFFVWNSLMAFVIFLHHTHPAIKWYDDEDEWARSDPQLATAVHVVFPGPINRLFHWIMEHNAHHLRPGIPLYRLPDAQRTLEERAAERIVVMKWSIRSHLDIVRRCKLYDYRAHRWMDFAGRYTSEPLA